MMQLPFGRTKALETQVDAFFDLVGEGMLVLQEAVQSYLADDLEDFSERIAQVSQLENQADDVSRSVETALYTYSLLPESRGDVLEVLERTDNLIDLAKGVLYKFEVELPQIPEEYHAGFIALTGHSINAADQVISAARYYFSDLNQVKERISKVYFYESEADRAAMKLKKAIFRSSLHLSQKQHLRYFAENLESLSDLAEDVAALLAIAAIKRSV